MVSAVSVSASFRNAESLIVPIPRRFPSTDTCWNLAIPNSFRMRNLFGIYVHFPQLKLAETSLLHIRNPADTPCTLRVFKVSRTETYWNMTLHCGNPADNLCTKMVISVEMGLLGITYCQQTALLTRCMITTSVGWSKIWISTHNFFRNSPYWDLHQTKISSGVPSP